MNRQGVSRAAALMLLLGLFVMHGVTASPSPVHVSDPLTMSMSASMAPQGSMSAMGQSVMKQSVMGQHVAMTSPSEHGGHGVDCAAGAICFALLIMALVLALALGRPMGLLPLHAVWAWLTQRRRGPPEPRPPSVYQLSVLRL
ncbi:hypothetical protein J4573_08080 [Actinomadura barringtoniae]|uniref:DUF2946 domain-containing protein n=1 Tax=Actinomadura barringtoniae TaxID=1427535 RepID=A0A939PCC2_9ACTN|nr:DUF6153 family protein [Actinomadura barringtoniae]MBO2447044.1 hypothetical protein [Actinomadura barringtoniae]